MGGAAPFSGFWRLLVGTELREGPLEVFLFVLREGGGVEGEGMHFSSALAAQSPGWSDSAA